VPQDNIPADKVVTYIASSVAEYRERLPDRLREQLEAIDEINGWSVAAAQVPTPAPKSEAMSGLPTDLVAFPQRQLVVDMRQIVNQSRFAA
jgi:hypothetical protein